MHYLVLFLLALAFEAAYTTYSLSVARGQILTASLANGLLPYLQLLPVVFLFEAETWPQRILVCIATSAGYMTGTAVVMLWAKWRADNALRVEKTTSSDLL
jgi:hypothetical protein